MKEENPASAFTINHCIHWPISFLCSIPVQNKDKTFIPEYIIPQLLLQCLQIGKIKNINKNEYLGIAFISTKPKLLTKENYESYINLAIPIKTFNKQGYCEVLKRQLKLTEPINSKILNNNGLIGEQYVQLERYLNNENTYNII